MSVPIPGLSVQFHVETPVEGLYEQLTLILLLQCTFHQNWRQFKQLSSKGKLILAHLIHSLYTCTRTTHVGQLRKGNDPNNPT